MIRDRKGIRARLARFGGIGILAGMAPALGQAVEPVPLPEPVPYLRPHTSCPADLETLVAGLIRDLPSYANRVARRSLPPSPDGTGMGTVLVAGRAELTPIDINPAIFSESGEISVVQSEQVFFTTLERQYTTTSIVNLEQYHWLFLTSAEDGWRLALMFSRTATEDAAVRPPSPPRESSDGIIGQAVQLWLRDCRAGAVAPIAPEAPIVHDGGAPIGR